MFYFRCVDAGDTCKAVKYDSDSLVCTIIEDGTETFNSTDTVTVYSKHESNAYDEDVEDWGFKQEDSSFTNILFVNLIAFE